MRTFFFLSLLACALLQAAPDETGIAGVISVSPARGGPSRLGVPDSAPLSRVEFVVQQGEKTVAAFTTDAQGAFRVTVPPGHYTVARKGPAARIGRYGPFEVEVTAGKMTAVEWTCDTGIR